MAKECPISVAFLECPISVAVWRDGSPTFPRQNYLLPSASTCKTWASVWRGCVVCQTVEDGIFGQLLLERVQGSKVMKWEKKRKGEKEQEISIHPVVSASTLVLGNPQFTTQLKHIKAQLLAYCPRVNHSHQVEAGWRTQIVMMSGWPNVGLWQLK